MKTLTTLNESGQLVTATVGQSISLRSADGLEQQSMVMAVGFGRYAGSTTPIPQVKIEYTLYGCLAEGWFDLHKCWN